jgi:hypothetical protein
MTQLALFPVVRHHCDQCAAEVDAAMEYMRLARLRGEYDAESFTPNERKAQQKRMKA